MCISCSTIGLCFFVIAEYAYSLKVNENIYVYRCGVVLLELIIGQHIVEMEFGDMINFVKWVRGNVNTKDGYGRFLTLRSNRDMVAALK